jgi:hypothetical protein
MSNEIEAKEKEVAIAKLKYAILEGELTLIKKLKEVEEIEKSISKYKTMLIEKGA